MFYGCSSLNEINVPRNVSKICGGAFFGCTSLRKIFIPSSVLYIEAEAFSQNRLLIIYCEANEFMGGWSDNWYNEATADVKWGCSEDEFIAQ